MIFRKKLQRKIHLHHMFIFKYIITFIGFLPFFSWIQVIASVLPCQRQGLPIILSGLVGQWQILSVFVYLEMFFSYSQRMTVVLGDCQLPLTNYSERIIIEFHTLSFSGQLRAGNNASQNLIVSVCPSIPTGDFSN